MKKIKIGILTHNFPVSTNDRQNAGIFVYDLAKALAEKSEVVVFSPGSFSNIKKIGGIKVYFFKFKSKLGNLKIYNPWHFLLLILFFIQGSNALKKFISENTDIDFIISMWAFPAGFFAHSTFKSAGIPYAIYALGSDIYFYAKKPILRQLITEYLKEAKFLIADSPDLSKEVERLSGGKTLFLPSASNIILNVKKKKSRLRKTGLTFLGRLEKVKGADILAEALISLKENLEEFNINIIGDGSLKDYLEQNLRHYTNIKFWGNLDAKNIAQILKNTDWLVIPSRSDSIPLVFSEAMKFSIPVIVSDLPDLKYLVKKYRVGYIFKREDSDSLAAIIKEITTENKHFKVFKKNTKKAAAFFDLEKTSDKLQDLIRRYA